MIAFPKIYRPGRVICSIGGIDPLLASWERKDHPDQIRLRAYRDELSHRVGNLRAYEACSLDLLVGVRDAVKLTRHHDLENYLTPLFGSGSFHHRQFPLVHATKRVGGGSCLTVAECFEGTSDSLNEGWCHLATNVGRSPTTKEWKQRLNEFVAKSGVQQVPDGQQVEFHMAWRCSRRRNWVWLWKPTGDALSPILGYAGNNIFNPNDDRITSLTLHRFDDDSVGNDVHVGLWWRVALD